MILYFSGTGNSKYVAQFLADRLQDDIYDMGEFIKQKAYINVTSETPLVIVSPVYVSAPPTIVMDFIKRSKFKPNLKAYFIMTCAGGMGAAPYYWKEICAKKGFKYMGCEEIVMPQNYLVFFKTKEQEENLAIIESANPLIEEISQAIEMGLPIALQPPGKMDVLSTKAILKPYYKYFIKADSFTVNGDCVSCGKCAKVCPLNNITIQEGIPVWADTCTHCMACINLCPKQAIEYGKWSVGKPRYKAPTYK